MARANDDSQPATKGDVREIGGEAIDAVLKGVENLPEKFAAKDDLSRVERKVDGLDVKVDKVSDQMDGLEADLSDTPSRKRFEKLKARVDKYHPIS